MAKFNRVRLRHTLKKLYAVAPGTREGERAAVYAQEMLDVLSTLAGHKPVCLHYRDPNEPSWTEGLLRIARESGLQVITGEPWNARLDALSDQDRLVPDRYAHLMERERRALTAHYLCRSQAVANEVKQICQSSVITVEQEARLLNYPECCVRGHYHHTERVHQYGYELLKKATDGDEEEILRRAENMEFPEPETEDDRQELHDLMQIFALPYTSVNMCSACLTAGPERPWLQVSLQGRFLAESVSKDLAALLEPSP